MFLASLRSSFSRLTLSLLAGLVLAGPLAAQVPLSSGINTETFDSLASGLPAGWSVTTGATATTLGSAAPFDATTAANWSTTTGSWRNAAAADNPGFISTTAAAAQAAAADRAVSIRQTGAFGDPGAALNFNFSSAGLQVTTVSFSAQMLSVQTRSTVWSLQYGLGLAPATWTTIATYSDPAAFGSTPVSATGFGAALDNQASVWLRVVALGASTTSGSRDTFGVDDFTVVTASGGGPVPPSITTPPSSQTVTEGAVVQFSVVAGGTAPFSYQWRKGGSALGNTGNISGALTDTLTLSGVSLGDAGNYDVVVTNAGGSTPSAAAVLTVNPALVAPAITTPPAPQSVALGGTATFSVTATGTAPLAYQWRKDGSPLANGGVISGATSTTLTVNPVSAGDVGSYDVVVSNGVSPAATSSAAALSLAALVTPTGQIAYTGGNYGQSFDTLPSGGTFTLASAGPVALSAAPINASGLGGWSLAKYDGSGTLALFRVDAGTSTSGGIDSYGSAAASDRALGSLSSGSTVSRFGAVLTNSTGRTITAFTLSYTGEQWRRGTGAANTLAFDYALGGTSITNGTFTAAPALNFTSPITTGSGLALDGNATTNRTAVSATIPGLSWAPGQTLVLRWTDIDDSGGDDGLAVDDLSFSTPVTTGDILPAVIYTTPADGTVNVATTTALSVTFNEAVNFTTSSFALAGSVSGIHPATLAGGPVSYTLTPATPFDEGETVTLTIAAAQVTDAATSTQHPGADTTTSFITFSNAPLPIHTIQGSGLASPYAGYPVTVQGVVVASFQGVGQIGGYYLEAPDAQHDANPATSEGIYVFDNTNSVTVGDQVTVTGTITEYGSAPMSQTEVALLTAFTKASTGNPLPTPVAVTLPFPASGHAERYEGMLVTLPQALTVTDNYDYGHFGEVILSNGRLSTPTNVVAPGAPAQALAAANRLNQIILDDGSSTTYPDPTPFLSSADPATATRRAGSTTAGVTGILDNRFGTYVIEPTTIPVFTEANPREPAPAVGGRLHVAIGNVLNFFNGDGAGGGYPTSRGATNYAEYLRQRAKIIASITALAPDIMGLTEMENDGFGPLSATADLVNGLNAAAPAGTTYAFVDGTGVEITTDVIHVAFIYRTETVQPVGAPVMLSSPAFNNLARNPLAQAFREVATGEKLTVCINHFRAKASVASGAGNADSGDGQGNNNALRVLQSNALTAWLATDPTGSGDPDFLIIGDLNAYAKEDPITAIEAAGYVNLTELFEGAGGYSYAFAGAFGHLDHALANAALTAQVVDTATWHVNSDEPIYYDFNTEDKTAAQLLINAGTPYRYSDHDPVVIGINLAASPLVTTSPAAQTVTVGDSVTFTVVATGTPAPAYQWRKGGNPISGATGATYTIPSAVTADAGSYDVVVTNTAGTVTSGAAVLTVNQAVASVTLSGLSQIYTGNPRTAGYATAPTGLGVTFTYDGASAAPVNVGSYAVVATVSDADYIGSASGTLVITPATASVSLGGLSQTYDGTPKPVTVTTAPGGLAFTVTYNGSPTAPTNVGSYAVVATVNDANHLGSASSTLVISPASQTITLGGLFHVYDGTPKAATVTTTPTNLTVTVTYNGAPALPVNPGVYAVVATITDPNYTGTASDSLVIAITALVRHAPVLNGGIDGSLQVLLPESITLNGSAWVSGDLLVPGTPVVRLNGQPVYGSTIDGTGAVAPSNYTITLNGGAVLRHMVRRTNALSLPAVAAPPAPAGTRNVSLNAAGQSPGSFATLRNLTLNGSTGQVVVPPGTYGAFTANGGNRFVFGVAGVTEPVVYNLQSLTLNGTSRLVIVGPVILNLATGTALNGSTGAPGHPEWLELNIASGGLTLNGNVTFDGFVTAPTGTVTINGNTTLTGGVASDRLTINGNGALVEPGN